MAKIYSDKARQRINRAVRRVEKFTTRKAPRRRRGGVMQLVTYAIAQEDIEHDSFGDIKLATAASMDSSYTAADDDIDEIFNPGPKIWAGSRILMERGTLAGTTDRQDTIKWIVRQAWSATRIRGLAVTAISPGGSADLNTLAPVNGHYGAATANVYLPTAYVSINQGLTVWAELVYRSGTGVSRWEVYSADCQHAGA